MPGETGSPQGSEDVLSFDRLAHCGNFVGRLPKEASVSNAPSEPTAEQSLESALRNYRFTKRQQLLLLLCNYIQLVHAALVVCLLVLPWTALPWRLLSALAALYLLPPILVRLVTLTCPLREGRIRLSEPAYFTWWALVNLQMLFNRFPALEEALRLIPTLYSLWLRLFGSRIGRFTYWAAGTRILDRSFLDIGDGVVFGAGTRIAPHLVVRDPEGAMELHLGRIRIGHRAIIGGYSVLAAGTRIAADECTRAFLVSPSFSSWEGGRRVDKGSDRRRPPAVSI
jgi:hypothetical protein